MVTISIGRIVADRQLGNTPVINTQSVSEMNNNLNIDLSSGISAFESKHFTQALKLLLPLAEQGEVEAQYRVAIMMQNGLGVLKNGMQAFHWMKSAAESGHALAQHGLGFMYMDGECVEQSGPKAVEWFHKAADQGLAGSKTTLAMMYQEGRLVEKNLELAEQLLKEAGF